MKYLILDHCSVMFRAYYAMKKVCESSHNIQPAVDLYQTWIRQFKYQFPSDIYISAYDINNRQSTNFAVYDDYKAGRHVDAIFKNGMPKFQDVDARCDFGRIGVSGHEADDVICSLIKQGTTKNDEINVISSDKDLLQLVTDNVTVHSQLSGAKLKDWTPEVVKNKFDIDRPVLIADYKAFIGDNSDGYPGVKGIGPKIASKMLNYYHSFENIYQAVDDETINNVIAPVYVNKLKQYRNDAFTCYQLAKLDDDIELSRQDNAIN